MPQSKSKKNPQKTIVKKAEISLLNSEACRKYHGTHFDKKKPAQNKSNPLLSCDWLQYWGKIKLVNLEHKKLGSEITNFNKDTDQTKQQFFVVKEFNGDPMFKNHSEYWDKDLNPLRPILHISYQPKINLPVEYTIVKVDNWALYHFRNNLKDLVLYIDAKLNIEFYRFSRVDICVDFQHFANRLHPQKFIQNFHQNKYIKRYACTYSCTGKAQLNKKDHYIRFGSKSQPVQWYLYNKSKELREKTDKPWIRELWKKHKLTLNQDVWRLEFSLKLGALTGQLLDENNVVIGTNSYSFHSLQFDALQTLFDDLFYHHCDFRINDGTKRKDRMKRVPLFKAIQFNQLVKIKPQTSSNRMDKIFIGMLEQLNRSWRQDNNENLTINQAISKLILDKGLHQWFYQKFINIVPDADTQTT